MKPIKKTHLTAAFFLAMTPASAATFDTFQGGAGAINAWKDSAGLFAEEDFEDYSIGEQIFDLTTLGLSFSPLPSGFFPAIYRHGADTSLGNGNFHIGNFPQGIRPTLDRFSDLELTVNAGQTMTAFGLINSDGQNSTSIISAFGVDGTLLGTVSPTKAQFGGFLSSTPIGSIRIDGGSGADGYDHWDYFVSNSTAVSSVPIPAGFLLLSTSLWALGSIRNSKTA